MPTKDTHIIDVKTKGAAKSQKDIKGVSGSLGGLAKQAGIAAAAYFGTRALLDGIKSSIDLFAKQELAEKKLRFAAGASTSELIKQAQALQKNTRFGDEAIIAQQAYVKSLGISTEQTKEIIQASVDLSAALGISLESSVMNVTKTLSGMQGELGEKLPAAFKDFTAEQLKAGEGIDFIREQFKGFSEEETDTLTGSLDQMSNAIGDAGEALGSVLAPLIIQSAKAVKFLAESFQSLFTWQDKYKALAMETLGLLSDQDIALMNNKSTAEEVKTTLGILNEITRQVNESNKLYADGVEQTSEVQNELFASTNELTAQQIANSIASGDLNEVIFRLAESGSSYALVLQALLDKYEALPDSQKLVAEEQELYNETMLNSLEQQEKQNMFQEDFIKNNEDAARSLGLVSKAEQDRQNAMKTTASGMKELEKASVKNKDTWKDAQKTVTLVDTYSAAQAAYRSFSQSPKAIANPILYQALGLAAAAKAIAEGMKKVDAIEAAQYGADFVTDGPQMMMVGEGAGPERVQVTPLVDENLEGPQGGGITLNVSGNVLSDEFTEDTLVPKLREALRLGNSIS